MSRTTYRPDTESAWPRFIHHQESGSRPRDCQFCGSPRVFAASGIRLCASCGYQQRPSELCLECRCDLNVRSRRYGLCGQCRHRADSTAGMAGEARE